MRHDKSYRDKVFIREEEELRYQRHLYQDALTEIEWLIKDFTFSHKEIIQKIGGIIDDTKKKAREKVQGEEEKTDKDKKS